MTSSFNAFLEKDSNYQLIYTRHQKVHAEARELGHHVMFEARKVHGLIMATDLLLERLFEHEDIREDDARDKELQLLTGANSAFWYATIQHTLDMMREQIVEQCQAVALADHNHKKAKESASQHCTSLTAAREEAEKRFIKQQAENQKK